MAKKQAAAGGHARDGGPDGGGRGYTVHAYEHDPAHPPTARRRPRRWASPPTASSRPWSRTWTAPSPWPWSRSPGSLDLKALATAVGGKRAAMADPAAAERTTGYVRGGISPLGQRRKLRTVLDASARPHADDLRLGGPPRPGGGARPRRPGGPHGRRAAPVRPCVTPDGCAGRALSTRGMSKRTRKRKCGHEEGAARTDRPPDLPGPSHPAPLG